MRKAHPVIHFRPRHERRMLVEKERRLRKLGNWPAWERMDLPNGIPGSSGWCRGVRAAARNEIFAVMIRPAPGGVTHLAITSLSQDRPTWWEAMRIKNELCGPEATAVEVYPPMANVIDEADMYHLWVLPEPLKFGLSREEREAT
jgi:hypothetical protein